MELKDVLHFYLPVAVELNNGGSKVYNRTAVAVGNTDDEYRYVKLRMGKGAKSFTHSVLLSEERVKPILRPLSSVTDSEWSEVENEMDLISDAEGVDMVKMAFMDDSTPNRMGWQWTVLAANILRNKGVDMDGLIESGKAIDATSLTQQQ